LYDIVKYQHNIMNAQNLSVTFMEDNGIIETTQARFFSFPESITAKELKRLSHLLGRKLSQARRAKSMTQEQLAARLNVSRQSISHWENDNSQPNVEMLLKLMQVLELAAADLLSVETKESEEVQ